MSKSLDPIVSSPYTPDTPPILAPNAVHVPSNIWTASLRFLTDLTEDELVHYYTYLPTLSCLFFISAGCSLLYFRDHWVGRAAAGDIVFFHTLGQEIDAYLKNPIFEKNVTTTKTTTTTTSLPCPNDYLVRDGKNFDCFQDLFDYILQYNNATNATTEPTTETADTSTLSSTPLPPRPHLLTVIHRLLRKKVHTYRENALLVAASEGQAETVLALLRLPWSSPDVYERSTKKNGVILALEHFLGKNRRFPTKQLSHLIRNPALYLYQKIPLGDIIDENSTQDPSSRVALTSAKPPVLKTNTNAIASAPINVHTTQPLPVLKLSSLVKKDTKIDVDDETKAVSTNTCHTDQKKVDVTANSDSVVNANTSHLDFNFSDLTLNVTNKDISYDDITSTTNTKPHKSTLNDINLETVDSLNLKIEAAAEDGDGYDSGADEPGPMTPAFITVENRQLLKQKKRMEQKQMLLQLAEDAKEEMQEQKLSVDHDHDGYEPDHVDGPENKYNHNEDTVLSDHMSDNEYIDQIDVEKTIESVDHLSLEETLQQSQQQCVIKAQVVDTTTDDSIQAKPMKQMKLSKHPQKVHSNIIKAEVVEPQSVGILETALSNISPFIHLSCNPLVADASIPKLSFLPQTAKFGNVRVDSRSPNSPAVENSITNGVTTSTTTTTTITTTAPGMSPMQIVSNITHNLPVISTLDTTALKSVPLSPLPLPTMGYIPCEVDSYGVISATPKAKASTTSPPSTSVLFDQLKHIQDQQTQDQLVKMQQKDYLSQNNGNQSNQSSHVQPPTRDSTPLSSTANSTQISKASTPVLSRVNSRVKSHSLASLFRASSQLSTDSTSTNIVDTTYYNNPLDTTYQFNRLPYQYIEQLPTYGVGLSIGIDSMFVGDGSYNNDSINDDNNNSNNENNLTSSTVVSPVATIPTIPNTFIDYIDTCPKKVGTNPSTPSISTTLLPPQLPNLHLTEVLRHRCNPENPRISLLKSSTTALASALEQLHIQNVQNEEGEGEGEENEDNNNKSMIHQSLQEDIRLLIRSGVLRPRDYTIKAVNTNNDSNDNNNHNDNHENSHHPHFGIPSDLPHVGCVIDQSIPSYRSDILSDDLLNVTYKLEQPRISRTILSTSNDSYRQKFQSRTKHTQRTRLTDYMETIIILLEHGVRIDIKTRQSNAVIDYVPSNSLYRPARWSLRYGLILLWKRQWNVYCDIRKAMLQTQSYDAMYRRIARRRILRDIEIEKSKDKDKGDKENDKDKAKKKKKVTLKMIDEIVLDDKNNDKHIEKYDIRDVTAALESLTDKLQDKKLVVTFVKDDVKDWKENLSGTNLPTTSEADMTNLPLFSQFSKWRNRKLTQKQQEQLEQENNGLKINNGEATKATVTTTPTTNNTTTHVPISNNTTTVLSSFFENQAYYKGTDRRHDYVPCFVFGNSKKKPIVNGSTTQLHPLTSTPASTNITCHCIIQPLITADIVSDTVPNLDSTTTVPVADLCDNPVIAHFYKKALTRRSKSQNFRIGGSTPRNPAMLASGHSNSNATKTNNTPRTQTPVSLDSFDVTSPTSSSRKSKKSSGILSGTTPTTTTTPGSRNASKVLNAAEIALLSNDLDALFGTPKSKTKAKSKTPRLSEAERKHQEEMEREEKRKKEEEEEAKRVEEERRKRLEEEKIKKRIAILQSCQEINFAENILIFTEENVDIIITIILAYFAQDVYEKNTIIPSRIPFNQIPSINNMF